MNSRKVPNNDLYNEDYYEHGTELKISGYSNYRWLPEQTHSMCESIVEFTQIDKSHRVLDFGCAKGFIVRAMVELGYDCFGADISSYAISKSHESIRNRLTLLNDQDIDGWFEGKKFDVIICKDVMEHIPYEVIPSLLRKLSKVTKKLFVIVPLGESGRYIIPEYEDDITHVIRENKDWWVEMMKSAGFEKVKFEYSVRGIKENWSHYPTGNGFILCETTDD